MNRDKIMIKTGALGIIVNLILSSFKATVGFISGSIAIILDAVNNLTDMLSSVITIVGTKLASKKPDKKHPFGHGRIEYFATIIIAILILLAGLVALKESIEKTIKPVNPNYTAITIIIVVVSIIVKLIYGRYVKKVGNKINSDTLIATGIDSIYDSILTLSTLVAALITIIFHINLEGIIGIIIALFIIKASIKILKSPIDDIIGKRFDRELTSKLKKEINSFKEVMGTFDLHLNSYGPNKIIGSCHIEVEDKLTAKEIHKLTNQIAYRIYDKFGIILTIGIYASNTNSKEGKEIKKELTKIISKYKNILQLHGFFIDEETKTIYFDLIISFDEENPNKLKNIITNEIKTKYDKYNYIVVIDADISD